MPSIGAWISVYASRTSAFARCALAAACCCWLACNWLRLIATCSALSRASATADCAASTCFAERLDPRLRGVVRRPRLVELLLRDDALGDHLLAALEGQPRVLAMSASADCCCAFVDASVASACLIWFTVCCCWKRRAASLSCTCDVSPCGAGRVVRDVGRELVWRDHPEHLVALDRVPFHDPQLANLSGDLRADDDVVGRDDPGEHERGRPAPDDVGGNASARKNQKTKWQESLSHGRHLSSGSKTYV